jgi:hypothetical protein
MRISPDRLARFERNAFACDVHHLRFAGDRCISTRLAVALKKA